MWLCSFVFFSFQDPPTNAFHWPLMWKPSLPLIVQPLPTNWFLLKTLKVFEPMYSLAWVFWTPVPPNHPAIDFFALPLSPPTSCKVKFKKDKGTRNNACRLLLFACGAGGCCFSYIVNSPLLPHNPTFSRGFVSSLLSVFQPARVIFNSISPMF